MLRALTLVLVLVASAACGQAAVDAHPRETVPAPAQPRPEPAQPRPAPAVPPEATTCRVATDCTRVPQPAEIELNGGPCCSVCAGYVALNRAYHASQPVCDPSVRGACPVSCAEGRPPPVACEAGHCVLTYPPVQAGCQRDHECITVPKLRAGPPVDGCRIACGQYVAGNEAWDAWAASLWQSTSVTGVCAPDCVDRLLPAAACVAGQCVQRPPTTIALVRVDLRAPVVTGSVPPAAITSVVTASVAQFSACRERPRAIDPIGYAGFEMRFTLGADGRATDIDAGELANHLPDVAACMAGVIRGLTFPRPAGGGTARVVYPMGAAFETR